MNLDYQERDGGVSLRLKVIPKAKQNQLKPNETGELVCRLQAPPVDGKANEALIAYLAETFGIRRAQVTIVSGEKSRKKTVFLKGVAAEQLRESLFREEKSG